MVEYNNKILKDTIQFYGPDNQLTVAIEEMSELTQVLSKCKRNEQIDRDHLVEEVADVYYMLQQVIDIFQITDKEMNDAIHFKQNRQVGRIMREELFRRSKKEEIK